MESEKTTNSKPRNTRPTKPSGRRQTPSQDEIRQRKGDLIKVGMGVSLATLLLTALRIVRPMMPLHPVAGAALVTFTLLHIFRHKK